MKTTILNATHRELGAKMVPFGGFDMPVQYDSIVNEHNCVRQGAGLFDLCHMGRFHIRGEGAVAAVDRIVTCNVATMKSGQIRYGLVTNPQGGVHDDILVYRLPDSVLLVVNAGNRDKLLPYCEKELNGDSYSFEDRSEELAMIAVQGPLSQGLLKADVKTSWVPQLTDLSYYSISDMSLELGGQQWQGWVSRTGYTGEDGFELYIPSEQAAALWNALLEAHSDSLKVCGLGARDTLRLEAGMPLYGHELEEDINPFEAGLNFAVKLKKASDFIGKDALKEVKANGVKRLLRGFVVDGKRVARDGMKVFSGEQEVGYVTSGAPSPTLGKNIVMALINTSTDEGAAFEVDIRGRRVGLIPTELPFYKREK